MTPIQSCCLILPVPLPKSISFSGGGARGSVYGPVLEELEEQQVLCTVEEALGVSAGAITAAYLALGTHPKEITQIIQGTSFNTLLGPSALFSGGKGIYHTNTLWDMLNKNLNTQFKERINELKELIEHNYAGDKEPISKEIDVLAGQTLSFAALEQLGTLFAQLGQPNKIKTLSILAVRAEDGKPFLFSNQSNQDIPIVDAVVASSAIPPVFKPHFITIKGKKTAFIDGGLYCSLLSPEYRIPRFATEKEQRLDSLLLLLYPDSESNKALHEPTKKLNFIMVFIGYLIELIFGADWVQAQLRMEKGVKEHGPEVISMNVDISAADFGVSNKKKMEIGAQSVASVKSYFKNYRDEAAYVIEGLSWADCFYQVPLYQLEEARQLAKDCDEFTISEIIKHRTCEQPKCIQVIQELLAQSEEVNLNTLDECIHRYCSATVFNNQDDKESIYHTNMERLLNGSSYALMHLFAQFELNDKTPDLNRLKEYYDVRLPLSAQTRTP